MGTEKVSVGRILVACTDASLLPQYPKENEYSEVRLAVAFECV
jgi:hypothetical protein